MKIGKLGPISVTANEEKVVILNEATGRSM